MITSTGNNRVRSVSALAKKAKIRREQGLFIVEGAKMMWLIAIQEESCGLKRENRTTSSFLQT